MKKRGNLLKYFLIVMIMSGITFLLNIPKAYAAGEHQFSLNLYNCDSLDEDALTDTVNTSTNRVTKAAEAVCNGPNNDGDAPLLNPASIVQTGKVIKVGVHYIPGAETDIGIQVKYFFDTDSFEPVHFTVYDRKTKTYSETLAYTFGEDLTDLYPQWTVTTSNPTSSPNKITMVANDTRGSAGDPLEDEMDIIYFYFRVKDDGEKNVEIPFEFDTTPGSGTVMNNKSAVSTTNTSLIVEGFVSDDNTLGSLNVKHDSTTYTLNPEFVPAQKDTTSYNVVVPKNIDTVDIEATPNDTKATLTGTGTKTLSVGNNSFDLSVLSESGETQIYTVNVKRLDDDATLSALGLTNVDFGTFDKDTTSYTATVPYTTESTTVSATPTSSSATVTGTGNKPLNVGENTISVEVTPENCKSEYSSVPGNTCTKKTYTVVVTREAASEDATLSDLKVDGTTVPGFDPDTYSYTLDPVENNKTSVNITFTTSDEHSTVTGDGEQNLSVGDNALKVIVTAQDGTTKKTYTINIHRKNNDATLSSLSVTSDPQGTLSPAFNSSKTSYTYSVDADEDEVIINAEATDSGATVTGTGTYNPRTDSSATIKVTAEDGTEKEYVITFDVAESSNANLSDLGVEGQTISPAFDKDTTSYNVTVSSDTDKATITGTLADDRSTVTGLGEQDLDYGENSFPVKVTAEDGTEKTYTVNITREKKTIATLSDLKVDGTSVPGFDPETYSYDLPDVNNDKTSVNITYTTTDTDATVEGTGEQNLSVGDNALKVIVTAQDGTTKKTYTINIRRKNDNRSLSSLTVTSDPQGTLSPAFDPETTSYTFSVDADEDEVTIDAEPADDKATVTGTGTYNPRTDGPVEIIVTSENGNTKVYTVTFDVAKSSNADLSNLGVEGQTISPAFDKDTTSYNVTVSSDTDKATITGTLADDRSTVTGLGEQDLDYGENSFPVKVTAEDGTEKTYTVNITREKKTIATLSDLKVDGTSVPGFDPETYSYDLPDVNNDKTSVNITYTTTDADATVEGTGEQNLSVGDNALEVVVTAQDGTTKKTYTINIRRKNDNRSLSSLTVTSDPQGTLSPAFDPETTSYTYSVDADEDEVTIDAEPADDKATVTGTGTYNPRTDGPVEIIVTSENGNTKVYTVTFDVAKSSNADLSNLGVEGQTISPAFDKDTTSYNVTVSSDTDKATITGTLADDRSTVTGLGEQDLDYGENSFPVKVTAEDGTEKTYTVNITREKKTIATLSDLKVDGTTVPGFDPETYSYNLPDVNNDKTSVNITYTTTDTDATVEGTGEQNLQVGDNALEVIVTAQDGTTKKTYTINIKRKSDDSTLKSLTITSDPQGTLSPAFDPAKTSYTYSVDADEDEVTIDAETTDDKATVTGTGTYNPRTDGPVELIVTSENGTTKTYTVTFDVAKSSNADLSDLGVEGQTISPAFDKDTTSYNVTVSSDTDKVTITGTLADDRSTVTGLGEQDLDYGENSFPVKVTAEDGTEKTYTVNVTREKKDIATLTTLLVDDVEVPGFREDKYEYDLGNVASDKTSIKIDATTTDTDATIDGTGNKNLQVGENSFDVVITAQNGTTTKTYTIKVKRLQSDKNLATLTVTSDPQGTLSPAFDPETTTYTYVADPDETEVVVNATVPDGSNATITGTGTYDPRTTDKVEIVVKAEDGTEKTYTVNLELAKSTNADLSSLGVEGYTITPTFDKDILEYTLTVPADVDSAKITATLADDRATLTGTGTKDLNYGSNPFEVKVTAEDGTTEKTYKVTITREKKTDATLSDIKVDGVSIPGFDPDTTEYTINPVNSDVDSIVIEATLSDPDATLTGTGTKTVQTGPNSFDIVVTAQDGETTKTYTVNVKKKSSDSSLSGITVTSDPAGTFEPAFDPAVTEYTYVADPDEDEVTISATPNQDGATISGEGTYDPKDTDTVELIVTAEDGTTTTYIVHLENAKSSNADLSSLGVTGETLSPAFDKDTTSYTVTVDSDTDKATITATAEDSRSTLTGTGEKDLTYGSNPFEIKVKAEDGTEKTYTIVVERELSSDVKLSDLKVDGETIDGFDPDVPTYTLPNVGNDVDSITIEATPENDEATVEIVGADANGVVPLEVGENTITVKVTAQDGSVGTYTVTVTREADDNNDLKSLEVEGQELTPAFDKDTTNYTLTVPSDVDSVKVNAEPDSDKATVTGTGEHDLQPGENTIEVKVTAEDGTEKTYTITVTKEEDDEKITSIEYGHTIEDGMIKTVEYKSVAETLKDQLDNENWKLHIFDKDDTAEIAEDKKLGTAMIIKLIKNDRVHDSDLLVVKGDVNGDGNIAVNDIVRTVSHYLETDPLEGIWLEAADMNSDGTIKVGDIVNIVSIYLED